MSVLTRILVLEEDAPPAPVASLPRPHQANATLDEQAVAEAAARALAETFAELPPLNPPASAELIRPNSGASDRVLPPVVTQRLRALVGRIIELLDLLAPSRAPLAEVLRRGELMVDVRARVVVRAGQRVDLSPREFDLLFALIRRRGAVATRAELLHEVWGPSARVRPRVVDTLIARLRRKLEDVPSEPHYVLTAVALGYRFAAAPIGESP